MSEVLTLTTPFNNLDFLAAENVGRADEAVFEVFARMLGMAVTIAAEPLHIPCEGADRTAIVGYSGAMRGCCEVQMDLESTQIIASAMLGGVPVDDDDSLDDAIGEICNMIAGGWKDRIPTLSSLCALSPPTIITGRDYKVQMGRPSVKIMRGYEFESHSLLLTLRREDIALA